MTKASGEAAGADKAEVSIDDGKTFKAVDLKDFDAAIKGKLAMLVRLTFGDSLKALKINAVVQNNPGALPFLSPGKNVVSVSVGDPKALGDNKLVVTYAYRLGSRSKSFEQLYEQGKEIAKQHDAKWSKEVTYVRKTFAASDLPATIEIPCPTPKGHYPVYPRMEFLRREVIAPNSSPLPLPDGAVEAKVGPNDELAALPMPLLIGTESAPVVKARAVKTIQIPLSYIEYVSEKGEVGDKGSLRWPKNAGEKGHVIASAVILDGDLKDLPAKKSIAAARLCVPISQTHDKAQSQLGVVLLKNSVEKGKSPDFAALDDIEGMVVLPQQPADAPEFKPAKIFAIDLTRSIKSIAVGDAKFHGVALRMVPNRGVDDGWTVRCNVSPNEKAFIEVDVYQD